jgi:hypothetical protein
MSNHACTGPIVRKVRDEVLGNLEKMLADAKGAGLPVKKVYVAGSATTSKPYPGDFDAILVLDKPRSSITSPAQRQFLDEAFVKRTYKGDGFAIVEGDSVLTECQHACETGSSAHLVNLYPSVHYLAGLNRFQSGDACRQQ